MTNPHKLHDRVRFVMPGTAYPYEIGTLGSVIGFSLLGRNYMDVLLDNGKTVTGAMYQRFEAAPAEPPKSTRPSKAGTKIEKIKAHFLSGKSLTQLEALGLYGAFRLAARVHELKEQGMKIETTIKQDPNGNPYAEYALRSARVR